MHFHLTCDTKKAFRIGDAAVLLFALGEHARSQRYFPPGRLNAIGLPFTIVTELSPSPDLNSPDGSVKSVTAMSALVDGVSVTRCCLLTRIEPTSMILSVLS